MLGTSKCGAGADQHKSKNEQKDSFGKYRCQRKGLKVIVYQGRERCKEIKKLFENISFSLNFLQNNITFNLAIAND